MLERYALLAAVLLLGVTIEFARRKAQAELRRQAVLPSDVVRGGLGVGHAAWHNDAAWWCMVVAGVEGLLPYHAIFMFTLWLLRRHHRPRTPLSSSLSHKSYSRFCCVLLSLSRARALVLCQLEASNPLRSLTFHPQLHLPAHHDRKQ